jgi:hypothetical protein
LIVPTYWAEARLQHRERRRQVTVRRFGWSDISQDDAQIMADARTREAFDLALAGAPLKRLERRVAYNGAAGVPIREELVTRHDETVITRNSYGALCLNTADVWFADIDFQPRQSIGFDLATISFAVLASVILLRSIGWTMLPSIAAALAIGCPIGIWTASKLFNAIVIMRGGQVGIARRRVASFAATHPDWKLRVYQTPLGLRLLAMHKRFAPRDKSVEASFTTLGVDPVYAQMCRNQNCFRARVSPKPWRVGINSVIKHRYASWRPEYAASPERIDWINAYDATSQSFSSCRFLEEIGTASDDPVAAAVRDLHDKFCRSNLDLPLA